MKTLIGFLVFLVIPIGMCIWLYFYLKKLPEIDAPKDANRNYWTLLKLQWSAGGGRGRPLIIIIIALFLFNIAFRIANAFFGF